MKVQQLIRSFSYSGISLPDPGSHLSVEQVKDVYAATYPELTSASVEGPETVDGKLLYTFKRSVGTKG